MCWALWKERNSRIFKNLANKEEQILHLIKKTLREFISIAKLLDPSSPPTREECLILSLLNLSPLFQLPHPSTSLASLPETIWHPPDPNIIKLNYDGASKDNPSNAGFRGVFRNHKGMILWIYNGNIYYTTNNAAELQALAHGFDIAIHHNFWPLLVEGDSTVATQDCRKIQQGCSVQQVSDCWRINKILQNIKHNIDNARGISFSAVRRKANKLAGFLANTGVRDSNKLTSTDWDSIMVPTVKIECLRISVLDLQQVDPASSSIPPPNQFSNHEPPLAFLPTIDPSGSSSITCSQMYAPTPSINSLHDSNSPSDMPPSGLPRHSHPSPTYFISLLLIHTSLLSI